MHMNKSTPFTILKTPLRLHLNHGAVAMMLDGLDQVYRYGDSTLVTPDYKISTARHVDQTITYATGLITHTIADKELAAVFNNIVTKYFKVHDFGEIIAEPTTSTGETDPELQRELAEQKPTQFEEDVAHFFYHLACFSLDQQNPDLFHHYVAEVRKMAKVQENGFGLKNKTAEYLIPFYKTVRAAMAPDIFDSTPRKNFWNKPSILRDVKHMRYLYNNIEGQNMRPDFLGSFSKAIEKWDGTRYAVHVNYQKKQQGSYRGTLLKDCMAHEPPRNNARFEGLLHGLYKQSLHMTNPQLSSAYNGLTVAFTRQAYDTSRTTYQEGPQIIAHNGKSLPSSKIIRHYDEILLRPRIIPVLGTIPDYVRP
jgi:hypothetical protein